MKTKKIEHIGIAVRDLQSSIKFYESVLGLKCYNQEIIEDQKIKIAFFKIGDVKIELLESTEPDSTIAKFIDKKGEGIHHFAIAVDDITKALNELKDNGIELINDEPRLGAEGIKIAFLHPKSTGGILIELCEI